MITTNKKLWFGAVDGAAGYRVWDARDGVGVEGELRDYQDFSVSQLTAVETPEGTEYEIPLFDIHWLENAEGKFSFLVTALDENGNQSLKPFLIEGIEIDFLPPPDVVRGGIR